MFAFGEDVLKIDCLKNMNCYLSGIMESHKDINISNLGNSGIADLLLYIVQCWRACEVDKYNQALTLFLYYSGMM